MRENTPTSNVSGRRPRHPSGGMIAVNSWCPKVPVRPAREEPMEPAVIPRYAIQSEIQSIGRLAGRAGCLQALSTWSRPNRVDHRRHGAAPGGRRVGHGYVSGFVTFRTREGRRLPGLGSGALLTRRNGTSCTLILRRGGASKIQPGNKEGCIELFERRRCDQTERWRKILSR